MIKNYATVAICVKVLNLTLNRSHSEQESLAKAKVSARQILAEERPAIST